METVMEKQPEMDEDRGVGLLEFENRKGREAEKMVKSELEKRIVRRKKQMRKKSNGIAKQVISIHSALSFGFVSQLWVDIHSWIVFLVEVRPNLLSSEGEKFLLEDVKQVGDVVLVEDESVMENEFKLVELQILVGYNVVTPRQRNIGKVRGYTFNINSRAVESLELDSLGISIIPSTLGLWDARKMAYSAGEMQDFSNLRNTPAKPENNRNHKRSSGKKLRKKMKEFADDWVLPMDFF